MEELRRKVLALLRSSSSMDQVMLVDLIIDVVARGLGGLGGRPRKGPPLVSAQDAQVSESDTQVNEIDAPQVNETDAQVRENDVGVNARNCLSQVREIDAKPVRKLSETPILGDFRGSGSDPLILTLSGSGSGSGSGSLPSSPAIRKDRGSYGPAKPALTADFAAFWAHYPRRVGKAAAARSWNRLHPPLDRCLAALQWQCESDDWAKDAGAFIPHPATWLNAGRWDDEKPAPRLHLTAKTRANIASGEEWLAMHAARAKP